MERAVLYDLRKSNVALITLNRPKSLNAINRELRADLTAALARFDEDDNARVAIITGAGRAFCAGRDLKERADDNANGLRPRASDSMSTHSLHSWKRPAKPLIAAINGYCMAGGFSIAQMCDLRVAAEGAKLGISEPRVGLLAPFGSLLPRLLPVAHALELILTAQPISAQRAYEVGFVNRVTTLDSLIDEAIALAEQIASNAPLSVQYAKELAYRSLELDEPGLLQRTLDLYDKLLKSDDAVEGPRAFVERRTPTWKGR